MKAKKPANKPPSQKLSGHIDMRLTVNTSVGLPILDGKSFQNAVITPNAE